jgi:AraC family transcriptional activator of tynA and feaB
MHERQRQPLVRPRQSVRLAGKLAPDMTTTATHDFSEAPPREIDERWELAMSALYLPVSVHVDPQGVRAAPSFLTRHELDDIAVVDLSCTKCTVASSVKLADDLADYLAVIFVEDGSELVAHGDRQVRLSKGQLVLWDPRHDAKFTVERHALKRNLLIPRAEIRSVLGSTIDSANLSLDGPCLNLLSSLVPTLTASVPTLSTPDARAVRNAAIELVAGALRHSTGVPSSARSQLRSSLVQWIEQHLREQLTPARVADAHSISVRTLNRLFSEHGETLSSYIRERRLERAKLDVLQTDLPLTQIAFRWGFSDASHFSRRFAAHFGTPPSGLRRDH